MVSLTLFKVDDQIFSFPTEKVQGTVKIDRVFPVPLSPSYVKGVINLRNQVIPLIDAGVLLWDRPLDSDTAIILNLDEGPVGIVVSKVLGITDVDEEKIKEKEDIEITNIREELIGGVFELNGGVVFLLNLSEVIRTHQKTASKGKKSHRRSSTEERTVRKEDLKGFVIFPLGKEWFAFPVDHVREIITFPENVSSIPQTPEYIEGVFLLRGEEVILISLKKLLAVPSEGEEKRVIILSLGDTVVGVAVDDVKEIKWVEEDTILSLERDSTKGVIALDGGKRLVLILDPREVLELDELKEVSSQEVQEEEVRRIAEMRNFVRFSIRNIEMVFPIERVKEVIEVEETTPLPGAPHYVRGMYNLRNSVIVIMDLAKKLGIEDDQESNKVIVMEDMPVGFVVSRLKGIMKVEEENIQPAEGLTGVEENILEGIIKSEGGEIIFILDVDKIVGEEDIKLIKEEIPTAEE